MASENALILRNASVRERLRKAVGHLRVEYPQIPEMVTTHRDQNVARVQEMEYFASVLETLAGIKSEPLDVAAAMTRPEADAVAEDAAVESSETGLAVEETNAVQSVEGKSGASKRTASKRSRKARK